MPSLKHGTVYRMQLDAAGTAVVGEPDENQQLKTVNRYRDVAVRPDGLALFIVTDVGGNTHASREGRRRGSRTPARFSSFATSPIDPVNYIIVHNDVVQALALPLLSSGGTDNSAASRCRPRPAAGCHPQ